MSKGDRQSRWRIYVVAHQRVIPEFHWIDPDFRSADWSVINVRTAPLIEDGGLSVVRQSELPAFKPLGPQWAETEAIYSLYRSGAYRQSEFVGFLHYDHELRRSAGGPRSLFRGGPVTAITRQIDEFLEPRSRAHISFATFQFRRDYDQRILADVTQPEVRVGNGFNCYDYILADYCRYFGVTRTRADLEGKQVINLCSSFLLDVRTFEEMMGWMSWVIESGKLEVFDRLGRNRMQGGLAERYYGVFLAFHGGDFLDLTLHHHDMKSLETPLPQCDRKGRLRALRSRLRM